MASETGGKGSERGFYLLSKLRRERRVMSRADGPWPWYTQVGSRSPSVGSMRAPARRVLALSKTEEF